MSFRKGFLSLGVAALLAWSSTAQAQPEFCNFTAVESGGTTANTASCTLTGGYTLGSIDWDGLLTEINTGTFGSEAEVNITSPLGNATIQLGSGSGFVGTVPFSGSSNAFNGAGDPAGLWTFEFDESFDDGSDGMADAIWDNIDFTFNAGVPPPPSEVVLIVDVSVPDQVTITATGGLSAVDASGSDSTGFYLDGIFGPGTSSLGASGGGDLTSANNLSDNSPVLFRGFGGDSGLNVYSYTDDPSSTFTAGATAFSGSGTWTISSGAYAELLAGATSGNVYFPADTSDDIAGANLIGEYIVIPEPTSLALLGMGVSIVLVRRRR